MDNSHRQYMCEKIEMQRNQFGLLLPPDPRNYQDDDEEGHQKLRVKIAGCCSTPKANNVSDVNLKDNDDDAITQSQQGMTSVLSRLKMKHKRSGSKHKLSSRKEKKQRIKDTIEDSSNAQSNILNSSSLNRSIARTENTPLELISRDNLSFTSQSPPKSVLQLKRERKDLFFLGITVLVNGYTDPSSDAIMRIMHKHGGDLEKYETVRVTHIIAESLSTAKAKIYKKQKRPIPVVKPGWIVDCVKAESLLPHADYLLEQVRENSVGTSVKSFFKSSVSPQKRGTSTGISIFEESKVSAIIDLTHTNKQIDRHAPRSKAYGDCTRLKGNPKVTNSPLRERGAQIQMDASPFSAAFIPCPHTPLTNDGDGLEPMTIYQREEDNGTPDNDAPVPQSSHDFQPFGSQSPDLLVNPLMTQNFESNTPKPSIGKCKGSILPLPTNDSDNQCDESKELLNKEILLSSGEGKSSIIVDKALLSNKEGPDISRKIYGSTGRIKTVGTDPNFLESYFNNSRLSFIGSFKQRLGKSNQRTSIAARSINAKRFVFHVDMDCFFAAIAIRNNPQYKDKCVAVGHAWRSDPNGVRGDHISPHKADDTKKSKCELSTCNYKARKFGVKKGMFLHRARELCPDLIVLPYYYDDYEDASSKVGEILDSYIDEYHGAIEQVSCDESYLEFYFDDADQVGRKQNKSELARLIGDKIRKDIFVATECSVSIGVGSNKLLAKLATNTAKNRGGNSLAIVDDWRKFLKDVRLKEIPGIGYKMDRKLQAHNLTYVQDVWDLSEGELGSILGAGTGTKVFEYCHGKDDRPVKPAERKTIGAECNYGVRFDGPYGVNYMMTGLAMEVEKRMSNVGVVGRHLTVKVKERKEGAGEPGKFNGHGKCNDHSKSCNMPGHYATRDSTIIASEAMKLYVEIGLDKDEIRGMGIVISKLECEDCQSHSNDGMSSWLKVGTSIASKKVDNREHIMQTTIKEVGIDGDHECPIIEGADTDFGSNREGIEVSSYNLASISIRKSDELRLSAKSKRTGGDKPRSSTFRSKHRSCRIMKSDGKYRQFDVKSMLKLASIKSGDNQLSYDGEQVSLTQLGSLPLEIQLQVANNENITECLLPRKKSSTLNRRGRRTDTRDIIKLDEDSDDCLEHPIEESLFKEVDVEESQVDDLTFLRKWMNAQDNVGKMKDFLCICVSEKRLDDVVSYLRLIRMREDAWGTCYQELLAAVEMAIFCKHNRTLDTAWLGL